ncbi:MAG: hypothetical protein ACFFEE_10310 [Candidatus Thorarchaeota archaeon]
MAFEDGLGVDPTQPQTGDFTLSATGLVSQTLNLWTRKYVQYVILVGLVSVVTTLMSFIVVFTIFGSIGLLASDPISYLFSTFILTTAPDWTYVVVTVTFGIVVFLINAVLSGATIKYALDDYSGLAAEIGTSFSYSFGKTAKIVLVQLIMALIVAAVTAPSLAMMTRALEGIDISDPFNPVIDPEAIQYMMMGAGLMLFGGIFMLYIIVRFAPAIAIIVDTELSAIDSLKKAWELTSGNFWHVFGAQILIGFVVALLGMVVSLGTTFLMDPDPIFNPNPYAYVVQILLTSLLFSAPSLVYVAVLYRDLVSRKGVSVSDLPEYVL